MTCYDALRWTKLHDLIINRLGVANQILGCRYDFSSDNPCVLRTSRGWYVCEVNGMELCSWRRYDESTTRRALARVDALAGLLWSARRAGGLCA